MKTIIDVDDDDIIVKNKNDFIIVEDKNEIIGITFDNIYININLTHDILDTFIEENNNITLITNTDYINKYSEYFSKYLKIT